MIIKVCTGKSCTERFSPYILGRLLAEKAKYDKENKVVLEECGCQGRCKTGPVVVVDGVISDRMDPVKASVLVKESFR